MAKGSRTWWARIAVTAALGLPAPAVAAPPPNDDFSASLSGGSTTASAPVTFTGTLAEATTEPGEPKHAGGDSSQSVWYGFTAPRSGLVTMSTCDGPFHLLDTQLAVYTGDAVGSLHEVVADDNAIDPATGRGMCPGELSVVSFRATAGTVYRIAVAGVGQRPQFTLRISYGPFAYVANALPFRINPDRRSLRFELGTPEPGATLLCRLDADPFAACDPLVHYWDRPLPDGPHTVAVTAEADGDTFAYPTTLDFVTDTTPPDTALDGPPRDMSGDGGWWEVALHSTERDQQQYFACSIDGAAPTHCANADGASGAGEIGLINQCTGEHTVDAAAVDEAGNVDPGPVHTAVTVPESAGHDACQAPSLGAPNVLGGATTVHLALDVGPGGLGTSAATEYGTTPAYGESTALQYTNGSFTHVLADDDLFFLEPSTTYHLRVAAINRAGRTESADQVFTTRDPSGAAPTARTAAATHVTGTTARLNGVMAADDACHQAYDGFELDGRRFLAVGGDIECTNAEQPVRLTVTDLQPGTSHRYRLMVGNAGGVARGEELTFTTAGAGAGEDTTGGPAAPGASASGPGAPEGSGFFSLPRPSAARLALRSAIDRLAARLPRTRARSVRMAFTWPSAGRLTLRWVARGHVLGRGSAIRTRAGRQPVSLRLTRRGRARRLPATELVATFMPRRGKATRAVVPVRARRR